MMSTAVFTATFGQLILEADNNGLKRLSFAKEVVVGKRRDKNPILDLAFTQLEEYFAGHRIDFTVPLSGQGTSFQNEVWEQLKKIPYGETKSYGLVASLVGKPKASRAVGMANNRNPIAIIIPCHRVIGKDKKLTGFAGGLPIKQFLLDHEQFYANSVKQVMRKQA